MGNQSGSDLTSRREDGGDRLRTVERRLTILENTLKGVVRESTEISLTVPCKSCGECLLVVDHETMYCPKCGNGGDI